MRQIEKMDRIRRLKDRLGLPHKRWTVRIKPGRHIVFPCAVVSALGLVQGDLIEWEMLDNGRVSVRKATSKGRRLRASPRIRIGQGGRK